MAIASPPSNGTLSIDPSNGAITYEHDGSQVTGDTFTYRINDELGATSNAATVTITIGGGTLVTAGLVAALESDAGVATSGVTDVVGWLDSSGLGNDLQTVVGNPQLATSATPSGQSAIRFDGDDSLARIHASDPLNGLPAGGSDRSMFIVAKYDVTSQAAGVTYGNGVANQGFGLGTDGVGGQLSVLAGDAGSSFVSTEPGTGDGWLVQSVIFSAGGIRHYRDGRSIDTGFNSFNTVLERLVLGEEIAGLGFVEMDLAAVLLFDRAVEETERQELDAYLYDKYVTNLPPRFTSPANVIVPESTTNVVTLAASDPNPDNITFSISAGPDMALFQIAGPNNDELEFIAAPDFENPGDANLDNIYELQVAAFDGTNSITFEMTVTVTDRPMVTLDSIANIDEGSAATLDGTITLAAALSSVTLDLSWGDPLSPDDMQSFILSTTPLTKAADGIDWDPATLAFSVDHQYLDDNPSGDASNTYVVVVSVTDDADLGMAATTVTVNNLDPVIIGVNAPVVDENGTATLNGSFSDVGILDTHTVEIDWGDGTTSFATVDPVARTFTADHPYLVSDVYNVGVTLTDDDTGQTTAATNITVNNVAPIIIGVDAPVIDEDGTATLNGSFSDEDVLDTHAVEIDWGDGTTSFATVDPVARTFTADHQYLDDDPTDTASDIYNVGVTLTDNNTGQTTAATTVTVNNLDPVIIGVDAPVIDEDGTATLNGSFSDVGTLDTHTVEIDWGDGNTSFATVDPVARTFTADHQYLDDDPTATASDIYNVGVTLTDDDTGQTTTATTVTVNNLDPVIIGVNAPVIDENGTATLNGSFSDVGILDTHTVEIDWGDGTTSFATVDPVARTFTADHQYLDDDPTATASDIYNVGVTLTDDDTGEATTATTVTVNNVAPTVTIDGAPGTADEGALVTLSSTVMDVGSLDTQTFDWQVEKDGIPFASGTSPTLDFTPDDDGSYTVILSVTDDDGGMAERFRHDHCQRCSSYG